MMVLPDPHQTFALVFSSPPQVPTIAPGNVQAEAVNSTTIRFTWTAPNPQFINGINQGYKVSSSHTLQGLIGQTCPAGGDGEKLRVTGHPFITQRQNEKR